MASSEKDNGLQSDTEGGEKPVREQLKKATINASTSALAQQALNADAPTEHSNIKGDADGGSSEENGRLHRKRSHEEIETDATKDATHEPPKNHTRKRSRDSTAEEEELNNGQRKVSGERVRNGDDNVNDTMDSEEANTATKPHRATTPDHHKRDGDAAVEAMVSPKTKRSRLHSTTTEAAASLPDNQDISSAAGAVEAEKIAQDAMGDDRTATTASTAEDSATKISPASGFANTSAVSPFGSLAGGKSSSTDKQTSSSAFAASGFSALSSSSSGFGAIGKQSGGFGSGGGFASSSKSSTENEKPNSPPASSFGGALGQKSAFSAKESAGTGFGPATSGFGKVVSPGGFGSGLGGSGFSGFGAGGLSSFASGKGTSLGKSAKTAKPFGAPLDDDEADGGGDENDDGGTKRPLATEEEKQDERFYEQELETGEEEEVTEFSARAKLYNFGPGEDGKKEWRERGLGVLRLNVKRPIPDGDVKAKARLLMRADGSHRVVLNTPVTKEIKFGAPTGGPPQGGYIYFMGTVDGKEGLELLQVKMKQINALELHDNIIKLQEEM